MSSDAVESWTFEEVGEWLTRVGLGKFAELFIRHEITGDILLTMTEADVAAPPLSVQTFGPLRKFGMEIKKLRNSVLPTNGTSSPDHATAMLQSETRDATRAESAEVVRYVTETDRMTQMESRAENGGVVTTTTTHHVTKVDQSAAAAGECHVTKTEQTATKRVVTTKTDDRATEMETKYPSFCWRYQDNIDFVKQQMTKRQLGHVIFAVSPAEFYVQPNVYAKRAKELNEKLNEFYGEPKPSSASAECFERDEIFENMPCVVRRAVDGRFYRAVVGLKGMQDAHVIFVDRGEGQFVDFFDILPLTVEFGRFPPLVFRCRIDGVRERTLVHEIVQNFKHDIDALMDYHVAFTAVSFADNTITVRLYNPATNEDFGEKYTSNEPLVPPSFDQPPLPARKLSDDASEYDEEAEDEEERNEEENCEDPMARLLLEDQKRIEDLKEKEKKMQEGGYRHDFEAFLDGAPVFTGEEEDDSDDEESKKLQQSQKKNKTLKQMKRESILKAQGKLLPSDPSPSSAMTSAAASAAAFDSAAAANAYCSATYLAKKGNETVPCVRFYPKQNKPPKGYALTRIVRVVSSREIYLRTEFQHRCLEEIGSLLLDDERGGPSYLADQMFSRDMACSCRDEDGLWQRGRFGAVNGPYDRHWPVILVDYGFYILVDSAERNRRLKPLLAKSVLQNEPQLYKCKLHPVANSPLNDVETALLKELLPEGINYPPKHLVVSVCDLLAKGCVLLCVHDERFSGAQFYCAFDRDNGEPYNIHLEIPETRASFVEVFETQLAVNRSLNAEEISLRQTGRQIISSHPQQPEQFSSISTSVDDDDVDVEIVDEDD